MLVSTLNAPIATKVVFFSRLKKCLRSLYGKHCGPRSDCSYRFSILNSSVTLGKYLQQTTSADDIFRCIFFLGQCRQAPCMMIRSTPVIVLLLLAFLLDPVHEISNMCGKCDQQSLIPACAYAQSDQSLC